MRKLKYYLFFIVLVVIITAFPYHSFQHSLNNSLAGKIENIFNEEDFTKEIEEVITKYDSLLDIEIAANGMVGGAVAVVYKNQVAFLKCYGVKKAGENDSINKHTIFRLASVSKTITGVLAGKLADEKILSLDDKVSEIIPGFKLKNNTNTKEVTVRHILSHTSGLAPHAYDDLVENHVPFSQIFSGLNNVAISAPPGKVYTYQNVIFSVFDTVTAVKTSEPFGNILEEKIFSPFKMKNASTGFAAFEKNKNKAYPHVGSGSHFRTVKLNDRYYSTLPAAGVNASISDMSNFMLTLLDPDSKEVNDSIRKLVFTPQIETPLTASYYRNWEHPTSRKYALGWRTLEYKKRDIAYHGGFVQGYRAEIALCFDEQVGIAFLSNSPSPVAAKTVPLFLNLFFEFKDKPAGTEVKP